MKKIVFILLFIPTLAYAQDKFIRDALVLSEDKQWIAQKISDGLVLTSLMLPCLVSDIERKNSNCWKDQSIRTGISIGITETVKRLVKRERPDKTDNKSFYSMHTALTCVSGLNRLDSKSQWIGAALCSTVGILRIAGDKHWFTDVLVGGSVGTVVALSWKRQL